MTGPRLGLLRCAFCWWYSVLCLCNVGLRGAAGQSNSNAAGCQGDQEEHSGKCYLRVDSRKTFDDAQNYCRDRGGIIAMVTNRNEDDVMVDIMKSEGWRRMWIGVREVNTPWRWVKDNSYISYQGCYADLAGDLLPNWNGADDNFTSQACVDKCIAQDGDYKYAGIKFSIDSRDLICSCAKEFSTEGVVKQGCENYCHKDGFTDMLCGGAGLLRVYRTDGLPFNGWFANQPNNNSDYQSCMSLNKDAFKWGDEECHGDRASNTIYSHICEYDLRKVDCKQNGYKNDQTSGKCVSFHRDSKLSWYNARARCLRQGGDLVKIDSAETQAFLVREASDGIRWWVGATNRKYVWGNGAEMVFSNFAQDQPEADRQDCVISYINAGGSDSYKWQSKSCDEEYEFVCEIDPPSTTAPSVTTTFATPPTTTTTILPPAPTAPSSTTPTATATTTTPSTTTQSTAITTTQSTTTEATPSTTNTTTPSSTTLSTAITTTKSTTTATTPSTNTQSTATTTTQSTTTPSTATTTTPSTTATTTPSTTTTTTPSTTTPSTTTTTTPSTTTLSTTTQSATTPSTTTTTTPSTTTTTTPSTTTTTNPSITTTTTTPDPVTSTPAKTSPATNTTRRVGTNGPVSTTVQDDNQEPQLEDDEGDDNPPTGVVIGIGVAVAVVFVGAIRLIVSCCQRRSGD